jgi:hypothetical protein
MMNATGFVAERSTRLLTLALGAVGALTVELQEGGGENVSLTGEIQPRYQANLGFRVNGKFRIKEPAPERRVGVTELMPATAR